MSKPVDNNGNPAPQTQIVLRDYQELPDELIERVLLCLSPRYPVALWACSVVSLKFCNLTRGNALWRPVFVHLYGEKLAIKLEILLQKYPIGWQAIACRVHAFLPLFSGTTFRMHTQLEMQIIETNNALKASLVARTQEITADQGPIEYLRRGFDTRLRHPVVVVGDNTFSIFDYRYVSKNNTEKALAAPRGVVLTHLSHEGEHIYGLSDVDQVFQWKPEEEGSKQAPIKIFKTRLSRRYSELSNLYVRHFLCREGFIVIEYAHHVKGSIDDLIEIIELESERYTLVRPKELHDPIYARVDAPLSHKGSRLIKGKTLYCLGDNALSIIDLKTGQEKVVKLVEMINSRLPPGNVWTLAGVIHNRVFVHLQRGDRYLHVFNLRKNALPDGVHLMDGCRQFGDLAFATDGNEDVHVYNLRDSKLIKKLHVSGSDTALEALISNYYDNQHLLEPKVEPPKSDGFYGRLLDFVIGFHE